MNGQETEMLLDSLESASFEDAEEALAALASAAIAINREIDGARPKLAAEGFLGDIGERIKKWIRKLVALVKKIATEWGAISYSIGVSLTGVDVSVQWSGPKSA